MRSLGCFIWKRGVVILAGSLRIETQVELIFPTEFEPGLGKGVIAVLRRRIVHAESVLALS